MIISHREDFSYGRRFNVTPALVAFQQLESAGSDKKSLPDRFNLSAAESAGAPVLHWARKSYREKIIEITRAAE